MSEPFTEVASIDYPIIDSDAHVNEPPELWQERVPAGCKQRAPKVLRTPEGDVWSFDDGKKLRPLGLTATAGLSYLQFRPSGLHYEVDPTGQLRHGRATQGSRRRRALRAGPLSQRHARRRAHLQRRPRAAVRLRARLQRVAARVLRAVGRPSGAAGDHSHDGDRRRRRRAQWAIKHGHKGALIATFPNGTYETDADDDRFWAHRAGGRVSARHPHRQLQRGRAAAVDDAEHARLPRPRRRLEVGRRLHPRHHQGDVLAAPARSFRACASSSSRATSAGSRPSWSRSTTCSCATAGSPAPAEMMTTMPSRLFHRNFWATFMIDTIGIELRHHMNVDHLMWSTDYPHTGTDWPNNRVTIARLFRGVPKVEVKKMLHDNCKALYHLDQHPRPSARGTARLLSSVVSASMPPPLAGVRVLDLSTRDRRAVLHQAARRRRRRRPEDRAPRAGRSAATTGAASGHALLRRRRDGALFRFLNTSKRSAVIDPRHRARTRAIARARRRRRHRHRELRARYDRGARHRARGAVGAQPRASRSSRSPPSARGGPWSSARLPSSPCRHGAARPPRAAPPIGRRSPPAGGSASGSAAPSPRSPR